MYLTGYFAGFLDSSKAWKRDSTVEFRFAEEGNIAVGHLRAVVEGESSVLNNADHETNMFNRTSLGEIRKCHGHV
jgi:hypothetical protein